VHTKKKKKNEKKWKNQFSTFSFHSVHMCGYGFIDFLRAFHMSIRAVHDK